MRLQELIRLGLEGAGGVTEGGLAALVADAQVEPMGVHLSRELKKRKDGERGRRKRREWEW
jgi:hypothetical protein